MPELKVLLAGTEGRDLTKLAEYRAIGGYEQVSKARAMTPEALIEELLDAAMPLSSCGPLPGSCQPGCAA